MANRFETYLTIAKILGWDTPNSELQSLLEQQDFEWDAIVIEASKHLVLPAIYCRLKQRTLLHVLPDELNTYLEELTAINRNRNKAILSQVKEISQLLERNNIKHLFMKGAAYIASDVFDDNGERMIGDIDILVKNEESKKAFTILSNNGYSKHKGFNYEVKGHRHLDRLIDESKLAAVEIHTGFFDKKYQGLINKTNAFKTSLKKNGIPFPNYEILYQGAILSWQINDKGYRFLEINFKVMYDSIALLRRIDNLKLQKISESKYYNRYSYLAELYFQSFMSNPSLMKSIIKAWYKLKVNYTFFSYLHWSYKYMTNEVYSRFVLFMRNKSYRHHAIKSLLRSTNQRSLD